MTSTEAAAATAALVKDLRTLALNLEKDLKVRAHHDADIAARLAAEYEAARSAERTAESYTEWLGGRVTQAAAAWVLSTVFVRYCEDNGLIDRRFLAGPAEHLGEAEDYQGKFVTDNPTLNNRDWLEAAFRHISDAHPTAAGLFDATHNPLWDITISYEAANDLIAFWRRRDDSGAIRHDFTGWDTRFLGDLYQDLSEAARKTYALLQTPEFVEEFILDLTLDPAINEFGLEGLRTIDPASGSGHFLLGLFRRILSRWRRQEPGSDDWDLIRRTMESVHGCDKNPFATSIARFRLLVAAIEAAGGLRLDQAEKFPVNVAVGDSLLHGRGAPGRQQELGSKEAQFTYSTEDVNEYVQSGDLLGRSSYHAVVANPPYITPTDPVEKHEYKERYAACIGKWVLSVPFAERLFQLAVRAEGASRHAGFVGQITANSFMKREFGKSLIEDFFPRVHLTYVIDSSGAYIPGHGTPTAILVGRNHLGRTGDPVRAVRGVRGEPSQPSDAARGLVWRAIVDQIGRPGSESEWVSVDDAHRSSFASYPWSLAGGGSPELFKMLGKNPGTLRSRLDRPVGFASFPGQDDVFFLSQSWYVQRKVDAPLRRPLVVGEVVRDWCSDVARDALVPYSTNQEPLALDLSTAWGRHLWSMRRVLRSTTTFGGQTRADSDDPWWTWYRWVADRYSTPLSIVFAEVATHNHFVLDRGGNVVNRTAPVIKLPASSSEGENIAALGLLNSSTACFWLKQVSQAKAGGGTGRGMQDEAWEERYQFNGTKLHGFPMPLSLPFDLSRGLDVNAQRLADQEPSAFCERETPTRATLDMARAEHSRIRQRMIALQEELDWEVYQSYGLLTDTEAKALRTENPEPLALGERAFEIVLARKVAAGEAETAWFDRHRSTPITELPAHWSPEYTAVVEARIAIIEARRDIALIERPECKRRWASDPWEKKEATALRTWLLDRCEDRGLWYAMRDGIEQPRTLTVSQLADRFPPDADIHAVAALYAEDHLDRRDMTLAQVLEQVVADEHVPYLAAMRYKDSGLEKRAEWERTWEGQREEDRTGENLHLPVPPKYKPADFRKTSYWSHRGKLDVPKERFVSYPDASPDADPTLLLGWAGWDHKDQAQALVNLVNDRTTQAGWNTEKVTPLLAGLAELMPWVHQWHGEYDPEWDGTPAEEYQTFLDQQRADRRLTERALRDWRPAAPTRGRRPRSTS